MNAPVHTGRNGLLTCIKSSIERSGALSDPVLDYIETTLFPPVPEALAGFLADDTDCDRDSLLDLIFFPDHCVQIDMEPLLKAACLSDDDEADLQHRLVDEPIHTSITMPDGLELARIDVPDFLKTQYLKRLNVTWQIDPGVSEAIEKGTSAELATIVRVRLRNAGMQFSPKRIRFLCIFFERMSEKDTDYLPCLDLIIPILESSHEETDGYDMLAVRKRFLFRCLQRVDRFETLLRKSNMETLMLQGFRAPETPREDLVNQMRLIDRTSFHLFGKTEIIATPIEETVRQISDLDTPEAMFKSLLK